MTPDPKTISPDALVASALEMLNSATILALFVVENGKPAGIIHLHDLLKDRSGLIRRSPRSRPGRLRLSR
jgi:CBS domain-containing protein